MIQTDWRIAMGACLVRSTKQSNLKEEKKKTKVIKENKGWEKIFANK